MGKMTEFYEKLLADESAKNELAAILGEKNIEEASDGQLCKIGVLAKNLGFDITIEEAKAYLNSEDAELGEDELDAVAGGGKNDKSVLHVIYCEIGGSAQSG